MVVNDDRQLVAVNHAFLEAIGIENPDEVLGLRLGESLHCVHAAEEPHGCGTTPYCSTCGAAIAIMAAIEHDQIEERVCALTSEHEGEIRDRALLVRAQPIWGDGRRWILIFAQDITQQQFWANLERVFFHDINNILSSLSGFSQLLELDLPDNALVVNIRVAAERLCQEIAFQRNLSQHKGSTPLMHQKDSTVDEIRKGLDVVISGHHVGQGKEILALWPEAPVAIKTDPLLASRVLGNMMINALEASPTGATIRLSTRLEPEAIVWEVWNGGAIADDVQKRVFQKHFSTKGALGRGLGTFSMKLFGEHYLHGKVSFVSSPEAGTTFSFRLPLAPASK